MSVFAFPSLQADKLRKVSMKRQGSACLLEIVFCVGIKAAGWPPSLRGAAPHKLQAEFALSGCNLC